MEIMGQSQRTLDLSGKTEFAFCRLCCEISEELFVTNTSSGRTITAEYCQNRSTNSYEQLKQKQLFIGQGTKCVILQRDDA